MQQNYFSNMRNRYQNDNFIPMISPEQIQRAAKNRIFREMVKGQIDYETDGPYFLDPKFLENMIIAASNELNNKRVIAAALRFYDMNFPGDVLVVHNLTINEGLSAVYNIIYIKLMTLKSTGDIGILVDIPHLTKNYRNII